MFGSFIKKTRKEKGIKLRELAKKIDISPGYLSDIEKETSSNLPSVRIIKRLSEALDVEFEYLIQLMIDTKVKRLCTEFAEQTAVIVADALNNKYK